MDNFNMEDYQFGPDTFYYPAKVESVVDGDTLDVIADQGFYSYQGLAHNNSVRLAGVDVAEKSTELGQEAINFLETVLEEHQNRIILHPIGKGKYCRWLSDIWIPAYPMTLNKILVKKDYYKPNRSAVSERALPINAVNINTAAPWKLQWLPGIGPRTADKIVFGRSFDSVPGLESVDGIGPATLQDIEPYCFVE